MQSSYDVLFNKLKHKFRKKIPSGKIVIREILITSKQNKCEHGEFSSTYCDIHLCTTLPDKAYFKSLERPQRAAYIIVDDKIYYKKENEYTFNYLTQVTPHKMAELRNILNLDPVEMKVNHHLTPQQLRFVENITGHRHFKRLESETEVIDRMKGLIRCVGNIGKDIHLDENYEDHDVDICLPDTNIKISHTIKKGKIKAGCRDNITRISFSEGSFYPSKQQGPISKSKFLDLVNFINDFAKEMPANMHYLFSSIPVVDEKHQVHNLYCYVVCGNEPTIGVYAKATPSADDSLYPCTTNSFATTGGSFSQINEQIDFFLNNYKYPGDIKLIEDLIFYCLHNPDYPSPPKLEESLINHIQRIKDGNCSEDEHNQFLKTTQNSLGIFRDEITLLEKQYLNEAKNFSGDILTFNQTESGYHYGGYLLTKTEGGLPLNINIDMCIEHINGLAQKAFYQRLNLIKKLRSFENAPLLVSHMITSASIDAYDDHIIGRNLTHADALKEVCGVSDAETKSSEIIEKEIPLNNPVFGNPVLILIYRAKELAPLPESLAPYVEEINEFNTTIQCLQHIAVQQPQFADVINAKLAGLIALDICNNNYLWARMPQALQLKLIKSIEIDLCTHISQLPADLMDILTHKLENNLVFVKELQEMVKEYDNQSAISQFFKQFSDAGERIGMSAVKLILDGLLFDKSIILTPEQLSVLTNTESIFGKFFKRYYDLQMDYLFPQALSNVFDKATKATLLSNAILQK